LSSIPEDGNNDEVSSKLEQADQVTDIWSLKVFRDPNATSAA